MGQDSGANSGGARVSPRLRQGHDRGRHPGIRGHVQGDKRDRRDRGH